jgi:hypothetical protein
MLICRNWNTALKYLNLSGNKRLEIKPTSAQDMSHASSFRKDLSDFTAMLLMSEKDVRTRFTSLSSGNEGIRRVTSMRPSTRSCVRAVKSDRSFLNNMAYGISDMIGSAEHLAMFDLVVPNFRGKDNESPPTGRSGSPRASQSSLAGILESSPQAKTSLPFQTFQRDIRYLSHGSSAQRDRTWPDALPTRSCPICHTLCLRGRFQNSCKRTLARSWGTRSTSWGRTKRSRKR